MPQTLSRPGHCSSVAKPLSVHGECIQILTELHARLGAKVEERSIDSNVRSDSSSLFLPSAIDVFLGARPWNAKNKRPRGSLHPSVDIGESAQAFHLAGTLQPGF